MTKKPNERSRSRSAARLAAVQALYQQEMESTPLPKLLDEFHRHRLGATIEDVTYADAEVDFFDDLVRGVDARREEIDAAIVAKLATGWTIARLDKPMRQILRAGTYELIARIDVPTGSDVRFWSWDDYTIEELWDYGFIEVSTDGGSNWTQLEVRDEAGNETVFTP